jgi:hypothetical protein
VGLSASLHNRGRVVRKVRNGARVEGRTPHPEVHGEWFRCRLIRGENRTLETDDRGRRRVLLQATLVAATDDLLSSDAVEIGNDRWQVASFVDTLQPRSATPLLSAHVERVHEPHLTGVTL